MNSPTTDRSGYRAREGRRRIVDRGADARNAVFIAGVAKNSTAQVCDALSASGRYRYVHEPFSDMSGPSTGFTFRSVWRDYVAPDDRMPELRRFARAVLEGRVHTPQTDRWTAPGIYERRLISECRLNLMLKWLRLNFDGMPIVLVTRHPCAVVASRILLERETGLSPLLRNEDFAARYLAPFADTVAVKTPVEKHALMWALDHYVPLREFRKGGLHVLRYEDFVAQPERELGALRAYLGDPAPTVALSCVPQSHVVRMDTWRKQLTNDEVRRIMAIVAAFDLDLYAPDTQSGNVVVSMDGATAPENSHGLRASSGNHRSRTALSTGWREPTAEERSKIIAELEKNLESFVRYIHTLKRLLFSISDAERWQMSDWDWLWPRHEPFVQDDRTWQGIRSAVSDDAEFTDVVNGAYAAIDDLPPRLDEWATEWDGRANTFLRYMVDKLDMRIAAVRVTVENAIDRLGVPAQPATP